MSGVGDGCLVVDPSRGCDAVLDYLGEHGMRLRGIVLTHAHFDHQWGIAELRDVSPRATVWVHAGDRPLLRRPDLNGSPMLGVQVTCGEPIEELREGPMEIGGFRFTVLHVPGHSPGGCAVVGEGWCLSGDSLFAGSIGRTDFVGGNMETLLGAIREKLFALPDATVVHPGHGGRTTIGREKRCNPFLRGED